MTTNNKKIEEIEFEKYLMAEHAKDYHGTDDDMPDDFEYWLENLEQEDIIKYANDALNSLLQEIEEKVIKEDEWTKKERGAMEPLYSNKNLLRNKLRKQQRKALKTIKERYL